MKKSTILLLAVTTSLTQLANAEQSRSVTEDVVVPNGEYITEPGVPDCGGQNPFDFVDTAAKMLAAGVETGWVGPLSVLLNDGLREAQGQFGGVVGSLLQGLYGPHTAACAAVSVVIPSNAVVRRIDFSARDAFGEGACSPDTDCSIGWSRFDSPVITSANERKIVTSLFRNWSNDRERGATMTVVYSVQ